VIFKLGEVVHIYKHSTAKLRQEDHMFEPNLGYIVRSCLTEKEKKKDERSDF
jgi:hypothetical protein